MTPSLKMAAMLAWVGGHSHTHLCSHYAWLLSMYRQETNMQYFDLTGTFYGASRCWKFMVTDRHVLMGDVIHAHQGEEGGGRREGRIERAGEEREGWEEGEREGRRGRRRKGQRVREKRVIEGGREGEGNICRQIALVWAI